MLPLWRQCLSLDLLVICLNVGVVVVGLLRQKHCSPSALTGLQSLMAQAKLLCIACPIHTKHHSHVSPSGGQLTDSWNVAFMEQNLEKKNLAATDGHGHN